MPPIAQGESEAEAVLRVRRLFPDSVAMLVPVKIGSGEVIAMGILDEQASRERVDSDKPLPFVCIVMPTPEHDHERARLKKDRVQFTEDLWRLKPVTLDQGSANILQAAVEVRAGDLLAPVFTHARIGTYRGRTTITCDVGGIPFSMVFDDPGVAIGKP